MLYDMIYDTTCVAVPVTGANTHLDVNVGLPAPLPGEPDRRERNSRAHGRAGCKLSDDVPALSAAPLGLQIRSCLFRFVSFRFG